MATCLAFAPFSAPAMGPKLERRGKPFPHLQPATLSRNLGGLFGVPSSDFFNSALATKITKKDSRVFPISSQKQGADYSRVQVSDSKSFLGGLLEKGLSAFLRSQVDHIGDLSVAVGGSNWELFTGNVRKIEVSAKEAVYKGIVLTQVDLTASKVRLKLGRKRFFQHPFNVNASIRVQEQDFNSSLASPLFSDYLEQIVSEKPSELLMKFDSGNLTFSTPDQRIVKHGQIEYPLTLSLDVDKSGQVLSVKSQDSNSLHKTFELGSAVKLTQLEFNNSWLSLTGEFLFTPSNW